MEIFVKLSIFQLWPMFCFPERNVRKLQIPFDPDRRHSQGSATDRKPPFVLGFAEKDMKELDLGHEPAQPPGLAALRHFVYTPITLQYKTSSQVSKEIFSNGPRVSISARALSSTEPSSGAISVQLMKMGLLPKALLGKTPRKVWKTFINHRTYRKNPTEFQLLLARSSPASIRVNQGEYHRGEISYCEMWRVQASKREDLGEKGITGREELTGTPCMVTGNTPKSPERGLWETTVDHLRHDKLALIERHLSEEAREDESARALIRKSLHSSN
ncbi:unnamed protein product [Nesidiocoris tenuis]|uniref:Uncharacterized protein n=1 Tax=Nesidiocoris tenuis TaxID=355587 RepID=A0A6H5GIY9_9HEMI|nr:unnamed protein product [Nesidiocoris tenuis]